MRAASDVAEEAVWPWSWLSLGGVREFELLEFGDALCVVVGERADSDVVGGVGVGFCR